MCNVFSQNEEHSMIHLTDKYYRLIHQLKEEAQQHEQLPYHGPNHPEKMHKVLDDLKDAGFFTNLPDFMYEALSITIWAHDRVQNNIGHNPNNGFLIRLRGLEPNMNEGASAVRTYEDMVNLGYDKYEAEFIQNLIYATLPITDFQGIIGEEVTQRFPWLQRTQGVHISQECERWKFYWLVYNEKFPYFQENYFWIAMRLISRLDTGAVLAISAEETYKAAWNEYLESHHSSFQNEETAASWANNQLAFTERQIELLHEFSLSLGDIERTAFLKVFSEAKLRAAYEKMKQRKTPFTQVTEFKL